jgi:hypothetical protein
LAVSAGAVIVMLATPASTSAQEAPARPEAKTPTPSPSPAPAPARLRLDIDRHIDDVLARQATSGLPRFEERVDVEGRADAALDRLLRGLDLACSPASEGPPPTSELNRFRPVPIPPYADFVAGAKALFKGLKRKNPWKGSPGWYLYAVRQGDSLRLVARQGEIPATVRSAAPGTIWQEIARFDSSGEATAALRRLERGFATATRQTPGEPPHPSMSIKCLPPTLR